MQQVNRTLLSKEEFSTALRKGLGRAYSHITPENHELYRVQLLYTCTHNVTHDPHSEEDRAPWLFQLLEKTGAPLTYKDAIIQALYSADNYYDWRQLLRLVAEFSYSCDDAFYAFCDNIAQSSSGNGDNYVLALLLGLAQRNELNDVADAVAKCLIAGSHNFPTVDLLKTIKERIPLEDILLPLLSWVASSPEMWADEHHYTESVDEVAQVLVEHPVIESSAPNELFTFAESNLGDDPLPYTVWADEQATEQDLNVVFLRLIDEKCLDLQLCYLRVFKESPIPRLDAKILCLAMHESAEIQTAAINALSNIQDSNLRNFIFKLLQGSPKALHNGALRLFFKNYKSEDAACIEQALSTPDDVYLCHALCSDILMLGQQYQDHPELTHLLIWAYENTPSSATRFEIVDLLIKLEAAPLALIEEACHDSDSMTRMFASSALESINSVLT